MIFLEFTGMKIQQFPFCIKVNIKSIYLIYTIYDGIPEVITQKILSLNFNFFRNLANF